MQIENFSNAIKNFLTELSGVKRVSQNTIIAYKKDLSQFTDFLQSKNISDFNKVNERSIRLFIVQLNEQKLSRTSISRKLSVLRGFLSFLEVHELIKTNPAESISNPKTSRKLPEIITLDSYEKILKLLDEESKENIQSKLIFELLYGCALRVSEVCNLNIGDVDLNRKSIKVIGKGNKTRLVPFGNKSIPIYQDFISNKEFINSKTPLLTTNKNKRVYP